MKAIPLRQISLRVMLAVLTMLLASCGFVHDEHLTGPYRLVAIDVLEEMSICYSLEKGNCIDQIPETVFSVGWSERFIVAKQHPMNNRTTTNYFFIELSRDSKLAEPSVSVTGPLSATAFEEKKILFGLPPFTKTIEALQ